MLFLGLANYVKLHNQKSKLKAVYFSASRAMLDDMLQGLQDYVRKIRKLNPSVLDSLNVLVPIGAKISEWNCARLRDRRISWVVSKRRAFIFLS